MKIKAALTAIFSFLAVGFFSLSIPLDHAYAAPSVLLSPANVSVVGQNSTTISVVVNSDATPIFGSDAIISYPSTLVDIVSVTKGDFFTDFSYSASNGTIEIHGYFASLYDFKAGSGILATIVVKPKQAGSTSTFEVECNNTAQTSQIINSQGQNILGCSNTNDSVVTSTANPTATPIPGQSTPTPTSGSASNIAPTCSGLSVNPASGYKPLSVNFSCTGTDANNDITSAEFDFGNGSKVIVDKSIGQFGSITTNYTYSTSGVYTVTCRLRDNNQRFSDIPDACKKTITANTRPVGVVTKAPTAQPTAKVTGTDGSGAGQINVSPTIGFGSRVALRPYVTPTGLILPTLAVPSTAPTKVSQLVNIKNISIMLGLLLLIIIIFSILRRLGRKSDEEPLQ